MKSKFRIDIFLELEKNVDTKLHYRDACGGSVIELESIDEKTITQIQDFFDEKNIKISFSKDKKYVYSI